MRNLRRTLLWAFWLLTVLSVYGPAQGSLVAASSHTVREDAYLREALDSIQANRLGDLNVRAVDSITGKPLSHASIQLKQVSHDFVFSIGSTPTEVDGPRRSQLLGEWFKLPNFEWTNVEPAKSAFFFSDIDEAIRRIRFYYPTAQFWAEIKIISFGSSKAPEFVSIDRLNDGMSLGQIKTHVHDYALRVSQRYRDLVKIWVTQTELNFPALISDEKLTVTVDRSVELLDALVAGLKEGNPSATIVIGTTQNGKTTSPTVQDAKYASPVSFISAAGSKNIRFDAVGINTSPLLGTPADYFEYLDRLSSLGKQILIHESWYPVSSTGGSGSGWEAFNEDVQAQWVRYMIIFAFGKPHVIGFHYNELRDGLMIQNLSAGLLRKDGSPREAFTVAKQLLESFTTTLSGQAGQEGGIRAKGFAGAYLGAAQAKGFVATQSPFHAVSKDNNAFTLVMPRTSKYFDARATLNLARAKIDEAKEFGFLSPVSKEILLRSEEQYETAVVAFEQFEYEQSIKIVESALMDLRFGFYVELQFQQGIRLKSFESPSQFIAVFAILGLLLGLLWVMRRTEKERLFDLASRGGMQQNVRLQHQ